MTLSFWNSKQISYEVPGYRSIKKDIRA